MLRSSAFFGLGFVIVACGTTPSGGGGTGGQAQSGGVGTTSGGAANGGASVSGGTGPTSGGASNGGSSSGGATSGGMASGGASTGGSATGSSGGASGGISGGGAGASGATSGGAANGGAAGGGAGGTAGGTGGSSTAGWSCPAGVTGKPTLTGLTPTRIASVPPHDTFNMNNGTYGNIEGAVWIGDALYVSEMNNTPYSQSAPRVVQSRILKVTSDGNTSIFVADSGSNGMAVDANGNIVAAVHKDGSLTRFAVPGGTATPVATGYMGKRFNTPNDLAIRSDGNIYFSDPNFQAPPDPLPQGETRVYRRDPSGNVTPLTPVNGSFSNPNGVTLSLNEDVLYVAASNGVKFPVMSDGSLGTGQLFPPADRGDGMVVDCAGNLYIAKSSSPDVEVYSPDGTMLGKISVPSNEGIQVTNVAFGGSDHKTLYITGQQNNKGLFQVKLDIPGRPY
jgi:gluconolactonase